MRKKEMGRETGGTGRLPFCWIGWTLHQLCLAANWCTAGRFAIENMYKISYHEFCDNSLQADGHITIFLHLDFG